MSRFHFDPREIEPHRDRDPLLDWPAIDEELEAEPAQDDFAPLEQDWDD